MDAENYKWPYAKFSVPHCYGDEKLFAINHRGAV